MTTVIDAKDTQNINGIIYEDYPYINGERKDEKLNKGIISLARRHKFYLPNIQGILGGQRGFIACRRQSYQIRVAKKKNATNSNYKVVGFIIYDFGWGTRASKGDYCLASLEYWLVDKKFQGQGIGRTLYEVFERDCQECCGYNFKVMFDKSDARLCDLYTKLGYKLIKKYDGQDVKSDYGNHILWFKICVWCFEYPEKMGGNVVVYESEVAD
jgi:ribosomal protein S18 acetylase RimI-like enzyme